MVQKFRFFNRIERKKILLYKLKYNKKIIFFLNKKKLIICLSSSIENFMPNY